MKNLMKTVPPVNPNKYGGLLAELSARYSEVLLTKYLESDRCCKAETIAKQSVTLAKALIEELNNTNKTPND